MLVAIPLIPTFSPTGRRMKSPPSSPLSKRGKILLPFPREGWDGFY